MHVNLENAEKAIEAARKKAIALKTQMCIAVVDSGANLKAFLRMDDAWVGSIDISIKKARTAFFLEWQRENSVSFHSQVSRSTASNIPMRVLSLSRVACPLWMRTECLSEQLV
jgi:uncharacterized protein GlcG (DUF336 family)